MILTVCLIFLLIPPPARGSSAKEQPQKTTVQSGYVTVDGKLYYYDENGVLQKGGIVGPATPDYSYADSSGVCCTSEEITLAANFIRSYGKGTTAEELLSSCYEKLASCEYERDYHTPATAQDMAHEAIVMFQNEKGNCYKYAACMACVGKVLGYPSRVVIGELPQEDDATEMRHAWNQIKIDGTWYIFDANAQMQEPWNTLGFFKMEEHSWITVTDAVYEITFDSDGSAMWKDVDFIYE